MTAMTEIIRMTMPTMSLQLENKKNTIRMVKLEYHSLSIKYKTGRYIWYHQYA